MGWGLASERRASRLSKVGRIKGGVQQLEDAGLLLWAGRICRASGTRPLIPVALVLRGVRVQSSLGLAHKP